MYDLAPLIDRLASMGEADYAAFNSALVPGLENRALGVRLPDLRQIAREIARSEDWRGFLEVSRDHGIYELRMLHGMVLGGAKCPMDERIALTEGFLPFVDNWAVCDSFISSLKPKKAEAELLFEYACACAMSDIEFRKRFGLVLLMARFRDEAHIGRIMEIYRGFQHEGYYARMGAAWGLATLWLTDRAGCLAILRENLWDEWTHNKAIQKLCESRRISDADKALAKTLIRRKASEP